MIDLNPSRNLTMCPRAGCFHNLLLLPVLIAGLVLIPAGRAMAQTFTTLHSFTGTSTNSSGVNTNIDGTLPLGGLVLSGNTLYGSALYGGSSGSGTLYALNTDGTVFTILRSFTATSARFPGGLILSGNVLYGPTENGGTSGWGTVFKVGIDGTEFTTLHSFTASDGANPKAALILSGSTLYGTAYGGTYLAGTVFAVNTNGSGFTNLYTFTGANDGSDANDLILSGNTLYGTAEYGGRPGNGTLFAVNTDGTAFSTLHTFTGEYGPQSGPRTNIDGTKPLGGLMLSGNTLYGTAGYGGWFGNGTVFAVNTDGTGFTNLYSFTATTATGPPGYSSFNSDGANPVASLSLSGNTLYGTAANGGTSGNGTVFSVNTDGSGFTTLHSFTAISGPPSGPFTNSDGAYPNGLIL